MQEDNVSLPEAYKLIQDSMQKDDRGVKGKFPQKSISSQIKCSDKGRWEKIVAESCRKRGVHHDQVNHLHILDTIAIDLPEPEPPPGYNIKVFEPDTYTSDNDVYKQLLK